MRSQKCKESKYHKLFAMTVDHLAFKMELAEFYLNKSQVTKTIQTAPSHSIRSDNVVHLAICVNVSAGRCGHCQNQSGYKCQKCDK